MTLPTGTNQNGKGSVLNGRDGRDKGQSLPKRKDRVKRREEKHKKKEAIGRWCCSSSLSLLLAVVVCVVVVVLLLLVARLFWFLVVGSVLVFPVIAKQRSYRHGSHDRG